PVAIEPDVAELELQVSRARRLVFGMAAVAVGQLLQIAHRAPAGLFRSFELRAHRRDAALFLAQPLRVLVEERVVVDERAAQAVELLDDAPMFGLRLLELLGELGAHLACDGEALLRVAALLGRLESLDLALQRRGLALRLTARG